MSFNNQLSKLILDSIEEYTTLVSATFDIPQKELMALWNAKKKDGVAKAPSKAVDKKADDSDDSPEAVLLMKKTRTVLASMCKEKGYKVSGKKSELVARLLEKEVDNVKKLSVSNKHTSVLDVVRKNAPVIQIRKNAFGRMEDPTTHLIFENKVVVGKQNESGMVDELTTEDIETCKQYKFRYNLPVNLNKNDNIDNEHVDELESESDESDLEGSDLDGSDLEDDLEEDSDSELESDDDE